MTSLRKNELRVNCYIATFNFINFYVFYIKDGINTILLHIVWLNLIKKITYNVILSAAKYLSISMASPEKTQHWVKSKNEDECRGRHTGLPKQDIIDF